MALLQGNLPPHFLFVRVAGYGLLLCEQYVFEKMG